MHLSGSRVAPQSSARRRLERATGFRVDHSVRQQHSKRPRQQPAPRIGVERRIEEYDVEFAGLACEEWLRISYVRFEAVGLQRGSRGFDGANQNRIAVDGDGRRGAARQRLERKRAGTAEEVERPAACKILPEPVKERLAHSIGRRAHVGDGRKADDATAMPSADNADLLRARRRQGLS